MLNETESEFKGVFFGDGSWYKLRPKLLTHRTEVISIAGNVAEIVYHNELSKMFQPFFKNKIHSYFKQNKKRNVFWHELVVYGIGLSFMCSKQVPDSSVVRSVDFIRGYFDTDGYFNQSSQTIDFRTPRIDILEYIKKELDVIGIPTGRICTVTCESYRLHPTWQLQYRMRISGKNNIKKFYEMIKPRNNKHRMKFEAFIG